MYSRKGYNEPDYDLAYNYGEESDDGNLDNYGIGDGYEDMYLYKQGMATSPYGFGSKGYGIGMNAMSNPLANIGTSYNQINKAKFDGGRTMPNKDPLANIDLEEKNDPYNNIELSNSNLEESSSSKKKKKKITKKKKGGDLLDGLNDNEDISKKNDNIEELDKKNENEEETKTTKKKKKKRKGDLLEGLEEKLEEEEKEEKKKKEEEHKKEIERIKKLEEEEKLREQNKKKKQEKNDEDDYDENEDNDINDDVSKKQKDEDDSDSDKNKLNKGDYDIQVDSKKNSEQNSEKADKKINNNLFDKNEIESDNSKNNISIKEDINDNNNNNEDKNEQNSNSQSNNNIVNPPLEKIDVNDMEKYMNSRKNKNIDWTLKQNADNENHPIQEEDLDNNNNSLSQHAEKIDNNQQSEKFVNNNKNNYEDNNNINNSIEKKGDDIKDSSHQINNNDNFNKRDSKISIKDDETYGGFDDNVEFASQSKIPDIRESKNNIDLINEIQNSVMNSVKNENAKNINYNNNDIEKAQNNSKNIQIEESNDLSGRINKFTNYNNNISNVNDKTNNHYNQIEESNDNDFSTRFNNFANNNTAYSNLNNNNNNNNNINNNITTSYSKYDDFNYSIGGGNNNKSKIIENENNHKIIEENSKSNNKSKNENLSSNPISNLNSDSLHIQNLISKEFQKYIASNNLNNQNYNPGIYEANKQLQNYSKSQYSSQLDFKKFNALNIKKVKVSDFTLKGILREKYLLEKLKLESALSQEQRRRELAESDLKEIKNINKDLNIQIKDLQRLKEENLNLIHSQKENDNLFETMKNDYSNLKDEYENKIKLMENRIIEQQNKLSEHKINEIEKKYQMDILKIKLDYDNLKEENSFLKEKNKTLEQENSNLNNNIESDNKIQKLKNDNFTLHEKNNLLEKEKEKLENENYKLRMNSIANTTNKIEGSNNTLNNNILSSASMINHPTSTNNNIQSANSNNNLNSIVNYESKENEVINDLNRPLIISSITNIIPNQNNINSVNIFDQLLYDREINTQEKLLQSYVHEIEHLNKEVNFLKSIPTGQANVPLKNNYIINENGEGNSNNGLSLNPFESYDKYHQSNNLKTQKNTKQINPSLKETAEEKIKKLQDYLFQGNNEESNTSNKMLILEREFNKLQKDDSPNEIIFDNFINVMKLLNVPLTSNELIEIFNNFPRVKGNRIKMNDFINALNSKSPSSFFIQSDPSYLNTLENKLIKSQNRIKELEKFILLNANECEDYKSKIISYEKENNTLKNKINDLNSQILNYFLFREEKNINNPDVIQMKEKIKKFESINQNQNEELKQKFSEYERKINNMQKNYDQKKDTLENEKDKLKDQIQSLTNDKNNLTNEYEKKILDLTKEIQQLNEKLIKYKKNYKLIQNKNEDILKENTKILNCLKDQGITPDKIMTFVNSYDNVQTLLKKIENLEKKNDDREERYKQLCINANSTTLNREIENLNKKHQEEKQELLRILAQRNNELNVVKTEFNAIIKEIQLLKESHKFK